MKRISLALVIVTTVLIGCKQATSPSAPSVPTAPKVISLEGVTGIEQEVGGGTTSIEKTKLIKDGDIYKGILISSASVLHLSVTPSEEDVDGEEIPETKETPEVVDSISVLFEEGESANEVTEKQEIIQATIEASYRQALYDAGVEGITKENVVVIIDESYARATATIENIKARSGYAFEGLEPKITFDLVGDFTGNIDITKFSGESVDVAPGVAGLDSISLATTEANEVSFYESEIFAAATREGAVETAIKKAFQDKLGETNITITGIELTETEDSEVATVVVSVKTSSPEITFVDSKEQETTVTISLKNKYGAFTGNLKAIAQSEISAEFLPTIADAVVMGENNWKISGGLAMVGSRKVAVKENSGIDIQTVLVAMKSSMETLLVDERYSFSSFGTLSVDQTNTDKTNIPVKLTKKDGYLFFDGSETYETTVGVIFQEGALKVSDEDFADTLEALTVPENLGALTDEDGNVTIQITEDITNEVGGEEKPFVVTGGTVDKPLNLTLEVPEGESAQVNGGGILTSLVVSGAGTTVTIGEGITINGGTSSTGGGVIVKDGGHFILDGGTITGNHSKGDTLGFGGAGVNVIGNFKYNEDGTLVVPDDKGFGQLQNDLSKTYKPAKFTMKSGTITGNSGIRGGGVYVVGADFIMEGGIISGNTANMGGGVYVRGENQPTSIILKGGIIENNTATHGEINGVNTRDTLARGYGGGLNISGSRTSSIPTTVTIQENFILRNNDASIEGTEIAVFDNYMDINIEGGKISHDDSVLIDTQKGGEYTVSSDEKIIAKFYNGGQKLITPNGKFLITNSVFWNTHSHTAVTITGGTIQGLTPTEESPLVNLFIPRSGE